MSNPFNILGDQSHPPVSGQEQKEENQPQGTGKTAPEGARADAQEPTHPHLKRRRAPRHGRRSLFSHSASGCEN